MNNGNAPNNSANVGGDLAPANKTAGGENDDEDVSRLCDKPSLYYQLSPEKVRAVGVIRQTAPCAKCQAARKQGCYCYIQGKLLVEVNPTSSHWNLMEKAAMELAEEQAFLSLIDFDRWTAHNNLCFPASMVKEKITELADEKQSTVEPEMLTNAWLKLWELLRTFRLIETCETAAGDGEQGKLSTLHLGEAPGGFVAAINHYIQSFKPAEYKWSWRANSLDPFHEHNDCHEMLDSDQFYKETYGHWLRGMDGTGNLLKPRNVEFILAQYRNTKTDLVTADGAFDVQHDPEHEEELTFPLLLAEVVVALGTLRIGGALVIKVFSIRAPCTVGLVALIAHCFEQVYLAKPFLSKGANSEIYVVALGFKGISSALFDACRMKIGFPVGPGVSFFPLKHLSESFLTELAAGVSKFTTRQLEYVSNNLASFRELEARAGGNDGIGSSSTTGDPASSAWMMSGAQKKALALDWINEMEIRALKADQRIVKHCYLNGTKGISGNELHERKSGSRLLVAPTQEGRLKRRKQWDRLQRRRVTPFMSGSGGEDLQLSTHLSELLMVKMRDLPEVIDLSDGTTDEPLVYTPSRERDVVAKTMAMIPGDEKRRETYGRWYETAPCLRPFAVSSSPYFSPEVFRELLTLRCSSPTHLPPVAFGDLCHQFPQSPPATDGSSSVGTSPASTPSRMMAGGPAGGTTTVTSPRAPSRTSLPGLLGTDPNVSPHPHFDPVDLHPQVWSSPSAFDFALLLARRCRIKDPQPLWLDIGFASRQFRATANSLTLRGAGCFGVTVDLAYHHGTPPPPTEGQTPSFPCEASCGYVEASGLKQWRQARDEVARAVQDLKRQTNRDSFGIAILDVGHPVVRKELVQAEIDAQKKLMESLLIALPMVSAGGDMIISLPGICTRFSGSLLGLLSLIFKDLAIWRPPTTAGWAQRRYVYCRQLDKASKAFHTVAGGLKMCVDKLTEINTKDPQHPLSIHYLLPPVLFSDTDFVRWLQHSNDSLAASEYAALVQMISALEDFQATMSDPERRFVSAKTIKTLLPEEESGALLQQSPVSGISGSTQAVPVTDHFAKRRRMLADVLTGSPSAIVEEARGAGDGDDEDDMVGDEGEKLVSTMVSVSEEIYWKLVLAFWAKKLVIIQRRLFTALRLDRLFRVSPAGVGQNFSSLHEWLAALKEENMEAVKQLPLATCGLLAGYSLDAAVDRLESQIPELSTAQLKANPAFDEWGFRFRNQLCREHEAPAREYFFNGLVPGGIALPRLLEEQECQRAVHAKFDKWQSRPSAGKRLDELLSHMAAEQRL